MKDKRLVIDHIGVGVRDYEESVAFYSRALAPLGLELVAETETDNRAAGFGYKGRDDFWIHEGRPVGRSHIAFEAQSADQVDAFHAAATEAGARDNGPPGIRTEYSSACQKSGSAKMNSYASSPSVLRTSKNGADRTL